MRKSDLKFRWDYFWYVFGVWMRGVLTCKVPKGMVLGITYGVDDENREHIEYHKGTLWEFVKWIVTHEQF